MDERLEKLASLVKEAYEKACKSLSDEVLKLYESSLEKEDSLTAKAVFEVLIENAKVAKRENLPLCQDTGVAVVWIKLGEGLLNETLSPVDIKAAVNRGIADACKSGYLRASVCDPITRKNTGDNTPAFVHFEFVKEPVFEVFVLPKGCGSENMSKLAMLSPSAGIEGIKKFVVDVVKSAGPNPCPPVVLGVGIGGNFETCALLSKKALLRKVGTPNPNPEVAKLEKEILEEVNALGIGPLGLGGKTTCFAVHIETAPCHIASLPVAVNVQCHSLRFEKVKIL